MWGTVWEHPSYLWNGRSKNGSVGNYNIQNTSPGERREENNTNQTQTLLHSTAEGSEVKSFPNTHIRAVIHPTFWLEASTAVLVTMTILMPPCSYAYRCSSKNKVCSGGRQGESGESYSKKIYLKTHRYTTQSLLRTQQTAVHHGSCLCSRTPPSSACPPCRAPLGKAQWFPAIEMQVLTNPHAAPAVWPFLPRYYKGCSRLNARPQCTVTTCKPLSLPEESISVTFQSPDAIHQARPPRQQRAAFSESISSGAEGLTGTHTSDQLSEESLITSAMKKKTTNPFTWDESHSKDNFDFCTTGKRAKKPAWLSEAHLNGLHSVHPQMQRCSF